MSNPAPGTATLPKVGLDESLMRSLMASFVRPLTSDVLHDALVLGGQETSSAHRWSRRGGCRSRTGIRQVTVGDLMYLLGHALILPDRAMHREPSKLANVALVVGVFL